MARTTTHQKKTRLQPGQVSQRRQRRRDDSDRSRRTRRSQTLKGKLARAAAREGAARRALRRPKHPEMAESHRRVWPTRSGSSSSKSAGPLQSVKNEYETRGPRRADARAQPRGGEGRRPGSQQKSVDYNVMEREAKSNRKVYEALLQREKELRVSSNSRSNNVRVVDHAEVPAAPMAPTGRRTWLLSLAVGLGARGGGGVRPRLHERHDQDAGGRHPAAEAAVPRPGAVGPRRQASDARVVARAARFRRSVPGAAHVADLEATGDTSDAKMLS